MVLSKILSRSYAGAIITFILLICFVPGLVRAQSGGPSGKIKGTIMDADTHEPIPGASVILVGTSQGAASDENGGYLIDRVPAGVYNVSCRSIGFDPKTRTDVVVRPGRITFVDIALVTEAVDVGSIKVTADLFDEDVLAPVSSQEFNSEEIRRNPGAAGDISRVLQALPSAAQIGDDINDIVVRGGSPVENGFYVDNIFVPNINHFPVIGASGGPIGMLNVDFIDDVRFSAGGFSSLYGDRLSSITEIYYREGNTDEFDAQLDLNVAGFGGIIEGPLPRKNGSYFLSVRRSYLDLIVDAIGTGFIPRYGDIQGKATWDIAPGHKLDLLELYGNSTVDLDKETSTDEGMPEYGRYDSFQNIVGLNWHYLWNAPGYTTTSLSYSIYDGTVGFYDITDDSLDVSHDYTENVIRLRTVSNYFPSHRHAFQFGAESEYGINLYNYEYGNFLDRYGDLLHGIKVKDELDTWKGALFLNYTLRPHRRIELGMGVRTDYFSANKDYTIVPRTSAKYIFSDKFNVSGAFGIYYQTLPTFLLSQAESNRDLVSPRTYHYVLAFNFLLRQDTRLTVEFYNKEYRQMPMDPDDPVKFVFDDGSSNSRFGRYDQLVATGQAFSRGVELLVQKKMARNLYGLVSAAFFKSRYRGLDGVWYDRNFDNQYLFNIFGGYRPNKKWELSFRWTYAGGIPYTPYDIEQSTAVNSGIIDVNRINDVRYPDYHSLKLRFDRRFLYKASSIVMYLELWNVYNRENTAFYYWNKVDNKEDFAPMWSFLPVFGLEYEF